jgi:glycosyltransferase involved in cell wall biosynthesis
VRLNVLVSLQVRRAQAILTSSCFSRNDLIASYKLPPGRVFVVPLSVPRPPPCTTPMSVLERSGRLANLGLRAPFFLFVGNLHPRKNVVRLIQAFGRARRACPALAQHQLAIVGGAWWDGGAAEQAAARAAAPGSVVLVGRVSNQQRDFLLRAAVALAYPSLFEGFGLPPLEAMAAGTPVVASATSALPEVLGDAALLVDPYDLDALATALVRVATDEALRHELRRRGHARAAGFNVRRTGISALAAFRTAACMD